MTLYSRMPLSAVIWGSAPRPHEGFPRAPTSRRSVHTGVTLAGVPTKRRRHAITETPPVQAALDELRGELASNQVELGELVILGAREKLARLRRDQASRAILRKRLAERIRARDVPAEPAAAEEVRTTGWTRG